jgi:hypothetical protein
MGDRLGRRVLETAVMVDVSDDEDVDNGIGVEG